MAGTLVVAAGMAMAGCTRAHAPVATSRLPALPSTPAQNLGPSEPPVVWIGGTLHDVASDHLELEEPAGAMVRLQRLGGRATSFFRAAGGRWQRLATQAQLGAGGQACVETLMDGTNLVALRVFLGAGCGPA